MNEFIDPDDPEYRPNLEDLIDVLPITRGVPEELKTKMPDAPDISSPTPNSDEVATDAEFFVNGRYRPQGRKSRTGATFEVISHPKEKQHLAFEQSREAQCRKRRIAVPPATFYVRSPRGTIGWVPWIGSAIAWPWEIAWEADLVERSAPDPKPGEKK